MVVKKIGLAFDLARALNIFAGVLLALIIYQIGVRVVDSAGQKAVPCNGCVFVTVEGEGNETSVETMSSAEEGGGSSTPKNIKTGAHSSLDDVARSIKQLKKGVQEHKEETKEGPNGRPGRKSR
jgi:hypothetical protein